MKKLRSFIVTLVVLISVFTGYSIKNADFPSSIFTWLQLESTETQLGNSGSVDLENIPQYDGQPYIVVNDNVPYFSDAELSTSSFEQYSDLDSLGR